MSKGSSVSQSRVINQFVRNISAKLETDIKAFNHKYGFHQKYWGEEQRCNKIEKKCQKNI